MLCKLTNDRTMVYEEKGRGLPLVWLHGFPVDQGMWQPQLDALSDRYRVLAVGLTGFGGSSAFPGTPSLAQMADDVATFLIGLGITTPVVLGGLSMGGYVALAFARQHASRLKGLILADTRAEPDGAEARANRDKMAETARQQGGAAVIEQMLPKLLGPVATQDRPELATLLRRLAIAQPRESIAAALLAMRDRPDATPGLAAIKVPTLVLVGDDDKITPPTSAQALAQQISGATLVTLPQAGHMSNLEQPDAFNTAVRQFLAKLS